jgi:hypothetical protein
MKTEQSHRAVSGPVWVAVFFGFALVAAGYFLGIVAPSLVEQRWIAAAIGAGLTLMVAALPIQFLYDLRHNRFADTRSHNRK